MHGGGRALAEAEGRAGSRPDPARLPLPGAPRLARPGSAWRRGGAAEPRGAAGRPSCQRGACGLGSPPPAWPGEAVRALPLCALPARKHLKALRSRFITATRAKGVGHRPLPAAEDSQQQLPELPAGLCGPSAIAPFVRKAPRSLAVLQSCAVRSFGLDAGHEDAQPCRCDLHSFAFSDQICGVSSQEASSEQRNS